MEILLYGMFKKMQHNGVLGITKKTGKDMITCKPAVKFLGLYVDNKLNWGEQIKFTKKQLSNCSSTNVLSISSKQCHHTWFEQPF